jgi:hypothetical protein
LETHHSRRLDIKVTQIEEAARFPNEPLMSDVARRALADAKACSKMRQGIEGSPR